MAGTAAVLATLLRWKARVMAMNFLLVGLCSGLWIFRFARVQGIPS